VSESTRHLLPRFRIEEATGRRQLVERVVLESRSHSSTPLPSAAGGDTLRLRGIPAVGRGVSGHIAGTQPGQALE